MIVSLEEIKEYLRLEADYKEDDNLLLSLKAAEEDLENRTGKVFNENNKSELVGLYIKCILQSSTKKRGNRK